MIKKINLLLCMMVLLVLLTGCGKESKESKPVVAEPSKEPVVNEEKTLKIVDVNSKSRPYAIVINNSLPAIKVQTGLNDAYLVYEFPVEGGITRSLALFKDQTTAKIGTVRSARHDFLDYALENDAIFVHFGWSHYAQDDIPKLKINNINGLSDSGFWRDNPEKLATEHTAYTSIEKLKRSVEKKKYRTTTNEELLLNYSIDEININEKTNATSAKKVVLTASDAFKVTYEYDSDKKIYKRFINGKANNDYVTKEQFTTKNIIVTYITYQYASDNYYLDINNTGSGKGYYITNGYAVPITWSKKDRNSKTVYKYEDGKEIEVNDGNTYIQLQTSKNKVSIK